MTIRKIIKNISQKDWKIRRNKLIFKSELSSFANIFRNNIVTLIVSAFGVVAALSWQDAIKEAIKTYFPEKTLLFHKVYVAIIITILSIIITYLLSKLKSENKSI